MDAGQVMETGNREATMSTPHDVPIRHSAPPHSTKTLEGSYQSLNDVQDAPRPTSSEVWAGAISRLQTQASLNTSMLESHRQKVQDLETGMQRIHHEMGNIVAALHEIQAELRAKPISTTPAHHDPGDLEVLVGQVAAATNKANEVDGLKMQLELMKNRMKRFEDQGSPAVSAVRPGTASTRRESPFHEVPPPPPAGIRHAPPIPPYHQPLPPMRTSSMASPAESHPAGFHPPLLATHTPVLESQGTSSHPAPEYRQHTSESSGTFGAPSSGGFRPPEPLPPPSTLSGWRPTDSLAHVGGLPLPPPPPGNVRPQTMEPEPRTTGWAAVNTAQSSKRPYEEPRQSPYESPVTGSPKRPKLAPIMPRGSYGDDSSYVPSSVPQSGTRESPFNQHSRAPSDGSQSQSQNLPTPSSASTPGHRFIISTAQADSQESWRPESERMMHMHQHHHGHGPGHGHGHGPLGPHGPGRGRGRGGRGRGRRGRGGAAHAMEGLSLGTPEWEKPGWTGSQVSPNGYYHPLHRHSPEGAERGGLVRRGGGVAIAPTDRETEFPATPLAMQGPYDPFAGGLPDSSGAQQTSGGKKTRTKPIRNAEGVLIRKDGRPDMRSVSSANNLRKVHAKKEAEREAMDGRTPTSARSLAPAGSNSMSPEDDDGTPSPITPTEGGGEGQEQDTQERHQELMSKIFPHGVDSGGRSAAERFFPRHDQAEVPEAVMKTEPESEEPPQQEIEAAQKDASSQMTDVVMREMSDAQAEAHEQRQQELDTLMPTVNESNTGQETGD